MTRPPAILYEGLNLTLEAGTGIATYARNTARITRTLGMETDVLISTKKAPGGRGPVLSEVALFDADDRRSSIGAWLNDARSFLGGHPFGIRARRIPAIGAVSPVLTKGLRGFRNVHAVRNLSAAARDHFNLYGSSASVVVDAPPSLFHATHPIPLRLKGVPNVVTIHDMVPIRLPSATLDDKRYFWKLTRHLCRTADHIVTVSEFSRRDIIELCGIEERRITNTYQAVQVDPEALAMSRDEIAGNLEHQFGLEPEKYFLFFAALEPKKNVARLISAYAQSGTSYPLIIAGGPGWSNDREKAMIADERFSAWHLQDGVIRPLRRIRRFEYLPHDQLVTLIRGARAVLFPSLYEGFGLPAVEAMLLDTPVLTSDAACMPEIVGNAAEVVDPYDIGSIAAGIRRLDADADRRGSLVAAGRERAKVFSADAYADRLSAVYREFGA